MKTSLLALAFAVASIPMFAAQTPAQQPAAANSPAKTTQTTKVRKHSKKSHVKKSKAASGAAVPSK